jgi:hypothetical protein
MEDPQAVKEQVKRHLSSTPIPSGPSPPNSPGDYINTLLSLFLFVSLVSKSSPANFESRNQRTKNYYQRAQLFLPAQRL